MKKQPSSEQNLRPAVQSLGPAPATRRRVRPMRRSSATTLALGILGATALAHPVAAAIETSGNTVGSPVGSASSVASPSAAHEQGSSEGGVVVARRSHIVRTFESESGDSGDSGDDGQVAGLPATLSSRSPVVVVPPPVVPAQGARSNPAAASKTRAARVRSVRPVAKPVVRPVVKPAANRAFRTGAKPATAAKASAPAKIVVTAAS